MNAEERLNRVRNGWQEFHRLSEKVEELEALATRVTPVLSDMPKGKSPKPKDDVWAMLADYKDQCEAEIRWYLKASQELEKELSIIYSPNIRTAMKYRYIDCLKVEDIADTMGYEIRSVRRFLAKGREIYLKEYKDE